MPRKKKAEQGRADERTAAPKAGAAQASSPSAPAAPSEQTRGPNQTATAREPDRPDPDRIAARAYELYVQRGRAEGRAMDDWLAAEGELMRGRRD